MGYTEKLMKSIRIWGLTLFLGLLFGGLAFAYLLAPMLIADGIESLGSKNLGAKLEVSKVELSLFPLGISLQGVEATDPNQPMQNLVEFKHIKFSLDSYALLWKKLVIEDLVVTGVQFNQARTTSGALDLVTGEQEQTSNSWVPESQNFSQQQLQEWVEQADLITVKRIKQLQTAKQKMDDYWQDALDKEKTSATIDAIKNEYQRLLQRLKASKFNLIKDRKAWKKLKRSLNQQKDSISQLSTRFQSDRKHLRYLLKKIKQGPKDDLNALLAKAGIGGDGNNLSQSFLGPQLIPWIKSISQKLTAGSDRQSDQSINYDTTLGQRIYFKDQIRYPDLLIKNIHISGQDEANTLEGKGANLGYLPWLVGQPAKLNFSNQQSQGGQLTFNLLSDWQSSNKMQSEINSDITAWQIRDRLLMQTQAGDWVIDSAELNARFSASFSLDKINLLLSVSFKQPKFSSPAQLIGWQKILATSLSQQSRLQIDLTASGDISNPKIKIRSSLDKLLATAIGEKAKQELNQLKAPLLAKITAKTGDFSAYKDLVGDFDQWFDKLSLSNDTLSRIKLKL